MTALAPLPGVIRQPFGSLDGVRLRNLSNVKNTQNALPAPQQSSLKRHHEPPTFDDLDSENVDPEMYSSPSKKNKTGFIQPFKATKFNLTNARPINAMKSPSIKAARVARLESSIVGSSNLRPTTISTPKNVGNSLKVGRIESSSAPAGRSPKSKRIGILSRRRLSASPFTRVNPPSASTDSRDGLPFSIDAALSGTVSSYKPKPAPNLEDSVPRSWVFDIREDSDDELMHNLMEHSTCTLDISDDESRTNGKEDKGKENIPPFDHGPATVAPITTSVPASRKNLMTDEPRTPLGDLDASEFYAEGCDVNSYVLIPAEKQIEVNVPTEPECKQDPGSLHPVTDSGSESEGWKQLLAQFKAAKKSTATPVDVSYVPTLEEIPAEEPAEIDIWESESAKAENEAASQGAELNTLSCVSNDELIGQI